MLVRIACQRKYRDSKEGPVASPTVHRICHDYCKGPEALSSNFRATELQIRAILICTAW